MNCIKCNSSIPEDKLFCPSCGHLNEVTNAAKTYKKAASSRGMSKVATMIGGLLLVVSFFLPWLKLENAAISGFTYFYEEVRFALPIVINFMNGADFTQEIVIGSLLFLFFLIGSWLIPIGGGVISYLAYTGSPKTNKVSIMMLINSILVCSYLEFKSSFALYIPFGRRAIKEEYFHLKHFDIGAVILFVGLVCIAYSLLKQLIPKNT